MTGFTTSNNLGKYLGVPILQRRVSKNTFAYILEGMNRKLAKWKAEMLSLAERSVLVQSALATIPVYTMQAFKLSNSTCDDIDRLYRDFLWGDSSGKKKIHLVSWRDVCKPRDKGGLGLRIAKDFNQALLAKLAWQIVTNSNKLCVTVIKEKYIKDDNFFTAPVTGNASWCWRNIAKRRSIVE